MNKTSKKQVSDPESREAPQVYAVEMDAGKAKFSRRAFLKAAAAAGAAAAASVIACEAPAPTETPVAARGVSTQEVALLDTCKSLVAHDKYVGSLAISPDGKLMASGFKDGDVKLWSLPEGTYLRTLKTDAVTVDALAFSPHGSTL